MRIILGDPNPNALWALFMVLQEEPDFEIVGQAVDAEGLNEVAVNAAVDLVLMDRKLGGVQIEPLIRKLHGLDPRPLVVVMSSEFEDGRLMLKAGADAFVSKGEGADWLLNVLRNYAKRLQDGPGTFSLSL